MKTFRMQVWGRVQGVLFRDSARRRARKLGLIGYAKNLADGSLEIVAQGDTAAIDELFAWAKHGPPPPRRSELRSREGPPFAHVEKFEITELVSSEMFGDFAIR